MQSRSRSGEQSDAACRRPRRKRSSARVSVASSFSIIRGALSDDRFPSGGELFCGKIGETWTACLVSPC